MYNLSTELIFEHTKGQKKHNITENHSRPPLTRHTFSSRAIWKIGYSKKGGKKKGIERHCPSILSLCGRKEGPKTQRAKVKPPKWRRPYNLTIRGSITYSPNRIYLSRSDDFPTLNELQLGVVPQRLVNRQLRFAISGRSLFMGRAELYKIEPRRELRTWRPQTVDTLDWARK